MEIWNKVTETAYPSCTCKPYLAPTFIVGLLVILMGCLDLIFTV